MAKDSGNSGTEQLAPNPGHLLALDGLRGIAVLAVMGSHLFPSAPDPNHFLVRWLQHGLVAGAIGVDLFFVLSGFLITGILYDTIGDRGFFRKFYTRRSLRIFPLYYGVLSALFILTPLLHLHWRSMQWPLLFYLQNTGSPLYLSHLDLGSTVNVSHFWSLAVEEQFYLVWPLLVFLIRDLRKMVWACLALSSVALLLRFYLAFHHADYLVINTLTLCRMDSLLAGATLALLYRSHLYEKVIRYSRSLFLTFGFLSAAVLLLQALVPDHPNWSFAFQSSLLCIRYTCLAIASAGLIGWTLHAGSVAKRAFELPALRFFGQYSYGLYVLHALFITVQIRTYRSWMGHISSSKSLAIVAAGLMTLFVSTAAALFSYTFFEAPFLRLKKRFSYDTVKQPAPVREVTSSAEAASAVAPGLVLR